MDSLFETNFENTQPLRKFEPLIRFDIDGNPQPRRPLSDTLKEEETQRVNEKLIEDKKSPPKTKASPPKQPEDLKRKVNDLPAAGIEPKRKQQKQTSITNFFKKS